MALASGTRLGPYEIVSALGAGGMGEVWKARDTRLNRAAGARAGHTPEILSLGITSHFFVGETAESARDDFFPYYQRYLSPKTDGGPGWPVDRAGMDQLAGPRGALMVGSAQEIAAKVLDMRATLGVDRFLGQVDLGGMPREMVHDSIRRFGEVVAPAVRHVLGTSSPA